MSESRTELRIRIRGNKWKFLSLRARLAHSTWKWMENLQLVMRNSRLGGSVCLLDRVGVGVGLISPDSIESSSSLRALRRLGAHR